MKKIICVMGVAVACAFAAFAGAPPALRDGEPAVLQGAILWLDADKFKNASSDWEMEVVPTRTGRPWAWSFSISLTTARYLALFVL